MASSTTKIDKLAPHDSRVTHHYYTTSKGHTYHYLQSLPSSYSSSTHPPRATALLLHGFPDFSFGWRYQIPFLSSAPHNLRLIVPDMLGYSYSDSPDNLEPYAYKSSVDDLAELVRSIISSGEKILVIGHDWGALLTYRFGLYHPELTHSIATVCIPFVSPPSSKRPFTSIREQVVSDKVPNWGYQIQIADATLEKGIQAWGKARGVGSREAVGAFLNAMYGGNYSVSGAGGKKKQQFAWNSSQGILFSHLPKINCSLLLSEAELKHDKETWVLYPDKLSGNGSLRGPMNWYRTDALNWADDTKYLSGPREQTGRDKDPWFAFQKPSLFIAATRDPAVPKNWSGASMRKHYGGAGGLKIEEVETSHWALWEAPNEVNGALGRWVESVLGGEGRKERAKL